MLRLLLVALVLLVTATSPGALSNSQTPNPRVIQITAERFEFWPSEIRIEQGEEVELRIRSADTIHGVRIVGSTTNLVVPKRGKGEAVGRFTATTPGRYTIECNRMCGAGHNFMRATLIVREAAAGGTR
jgi:cytochrome c oxidase subunit II